MSERVRAQKVISAAGLMSRRSAEDAIAAGRVTIDGKTAVLGDRADPATSVVTIDGHRIPVAPDLRTYLVYKPVGVVSTADDPQGRPTVVDLVDETVRLWPVGRLDLDSEGLILVSNDGHLTNIVTHPRHGVRKTYLALMIGSVPDRAIRRLRDGVELEDGPAAALEARVVERLPDRTLVRLVMGEGRNREVRRMADAIGHPVEALVRVAIGPVTDRSLAPGSCRRLSPEEVAGLYSQEARVSPDE